MKIKQHQKQKDRKDWLLHLEKGLTAGSTLALVLAQLRGKKGPVGWIAIGLSATQFVVSFRKQFQELSTPDLWSYFTEDGDEWNMVPPLLAKLLIKSCEAQEEIAKSSVFELHEGYIAGELIAWRTSGSHLDYGPFFRRGREEATLRALGTKLWNQIDGKHAVLGDKGAIEGSDEKIDHELVEFDALTKLHERVEKFYQAGATRSYLLEGPPGTGKSTAVRYLLSKMDMTSLRLNFHTASHGSRWDQDGVTQNVEALLQALRPEMLIIDDFDRNWMDERELLRLMELAHRHCRVVIATINHKYKLSSAMQRVGRFDDHIVVDRIELKVLKAMLDPELHKYARKMAKWPIAFVGDFNSRKRVLGVMAAEEEFLELHARATGTRPKKKSTKKKRTAKKRSTKKKVAKRTSGKVRKAKAS